MGATIGRLKPCNDEMRKNPYTVNPLKCNSRFKQEKPIALILCD